MAKKKNTTVKHNGKKAVGLKPMSSVKSPDDLQSFGTDVYGGEPISVEYSDLVKAKLHALCGVTTGRHIVMPDHDRMDVGKRRSIIRHAMEKIKLQFDVSYMMVVRAESILVYKTGGTGKRIAHSSSEKPIFQRTTGNRTHG